MRTADEELRLWQVAQKLADTGDTRMVAGLKRADDLNRKLHFHDIERRALAARMVDAEQAILDEVAALEALP